MTGALALSPDQSEWTASQKAALQQIGLENVTASDLQVFLHVAQRSGLDPFARQIYMIARKQNVKGRDGRWSEVWKQTIQTGIDGFRLIADRTSKYAGQVGPEWCGEDGVWKDVWLARTPPAAARVGVLRKDFTAPLYAVAVFSEYALYVNGEPTKMWASKPAIMIAKCAEALALRKAFPQDLSGLYTSDEMAQGDIIDAPVNLGPRTISPDAGRAVVDAVPDPPVPAAPEPTVPAPEDLPPAQPPIELPADWWRSLEEAGSGLDLDDVENLGSMAADANDEGAIQAARATWLVVKASLAQQSPLDPDQERAVLALPNASGDGLR